jgi:hypothetical protein
MPTPPNMVPPPPGIPGLPQQPLPAHLARGVDLNVVRHKHTHQHHYVVVAHYAINDEMMAEFNKVSEDAKASGVDSSINLELSPDKMVNVQGPGCFKCGTHWTDAQNGYGTLCPVEDPPDWIAAQKAKEAAEHPEKKVTPDPPPTWNGTRTLSLVDGGAEGTDAGVSNDAS